MQDYDVIVIGGGVNGLAAAAYLGRSGVRTLVLEARGECGTHCDTCEPGIPGYLHNTHATWLISAMSPAMEDLNLTEFGLEYLGTEYVFGKPFLDGTNSLMAVNPFQTLSNWQKISEKDAGYLMRAGEYMVTRMEEIKQILHDFLAKAPSEAIKKGMADFNNEFYASCGFNFTFDQVWDMDGFQVADTFYESEYIKTLVLAFSWIGGLPPIHKTVGSIGTAIFCALSGPIFPVQQAKGGSHALIHSLIKAATAYGVKLLPCCPVKEIIVANNEAKGVVLSEKAVFSNERIYAKKIISNLTLAPTFLNLIGEGKIGADMARIIRKFRYDEQNIFCMNFALDKAPQFASADFDDGIQRCFMGYFGGNNTAEFKKFNQDLVRGVIHETPMANWFVPTLADPTQAPPGCHTAIIWQDVPPEAKLWKKGSLNGMKCWDDIKYELADMITDEFEKYAPGFKQSIQDRVVYSPLDIERNNPSAVLGNWVGGSVLPEQFYMNRPVKGVLKNGGSRTFLKNLYLSNSIHPMGATFLTSGYIAATEVAEDLGVGKPEWWRSRSFDWYLNNINNIPLNRGVR